MRIGIDGYNLAIPNGTGVATYGFSLTKAVAAMGHAPEGVFGIDPGPQHGNPMGTTHGGILATLLDSAMTCAVQSKLPAGAWPTTLELSVRFLKAVPPGVGRVEATGTALQVGARVGTAEGRLTGPDGTVYAVAQTTCLVLAERS